MALETFVEDGDHVRFSVQAFINGCLNDSQEDGYESLSGAAEYAKELAGSYFGENDDEGQYTKATPDVVVTGPDGTEYVTRWIVERLVPRTDGSGFEVNPWTAQHLVTVETYEHGVRCAECGEWIEDDEDRLMTFQTACPVQDDLSICLSCVPEMEAQGYIRLEDAVYTVLPEDEEEASMVPSWTRNVVAMIRITGEQASARGEFTTLMDHLDDVYGRDTRNLAEGGS